MSRINVSTELKTKRDRVQFILEHWTDTYETSYEGSPGDGDGYIPQMPSVYHHPSVRELRRAVIQAKLAEPASVIHTMAYYTAEWRNTTQTMTRKSKKGRIRVDVRVRQRVLPRWIVLAHIDRGVSAISEAFRGEVFVPQEMLGDAEQAA